MPRGLDAACGRGAGVGVGVWVDDGCAGASDAGTAAAFEVDGSGVMMLTGGIEAADGNSALVGLPVGTEAPSGDVTAVAGGIAAAASCAATQDGP